MKEQKEVTAKYVAAAHRNIDIAEGRWMSLTNILSRDLMSPLFDGDLPAHVSKLKLVEEIETGLKLTKWGRPTGYTTHVIVDFITKMPQMPLAQFPTLDSVIQATINSVSSLCNHANHIHVVLMLYPCSYIEMSLKEEWRMRRTDTGTIIDIIGMKKTLQLCSKLTNSGFCWEQE